jgi:UDP-N-acetylmuramate dehydrogenase
VEVEMQENVRLAEYTTLGVGGPARFFCRVTEESDLRPAVEFARERGLPVFVLGGGSNLLVADEGFGGVVVQAAIAGQIGTTSSAATTAFDVPAGMDWDSFVRMACDQGASGVECLAGIPGLVGGSPVQNIGAYGQEVAQTIVSLRVFDLESLEFRELPASECGFAYRTSLFNSTARGRYMVTRVVFRLSRGGSAGLVYPDLRRHFAGRPTPTPIELYEAVRAIRETKGMLAGQDGPDGRSAGSFFKNPVVPAETLGRIAAGAGVGVEDVPRYPAAEGMVKLPAAWLVERAGFGRGYRMGRAGISTRHTLALVNLGGATAAEIAELRDAVADGVERRFDVRLEQEPVTLP